MRIVKGKVHWEGTGSGAVRQPETSNRPPQGNAAFGPSGRGSHPNRAAHPSGRAVLRSAQRADSPLRVLSPDVRECHLRPTSPAECLNPSTNPASGLGHSGAGFAVLSLHRCSNCLRWYRRPELLRSYECRPSGEQEFQNATPIL